MVFDVDTTDHVHAGNGFQGFQTPIQNDSFIVDGMGALGQTHTERGLTYFEVALSGHMYVALSPSFLSRYIADVRTRCRRVPQFSPRVSLYGHHRAKVKGTDETFLVFRLHSRLWSSSWASGRTRRWLR